MIVALCIAMPLVAPHGVRAAENKLAVGTVLKILHTRTNGEREKIRTLLERLAIALAQGCQSESSLDYYDRSRLVDVERELSTAISPLFESLSGPALGQLRRLDVLVVFEGSGHGAVMARAIDVRSARVLSANICQASLLSSDVGCVSVLVSNLRGEALRRIAAAKRRQEFDEARRIQQAAEAEKLRKQEAQDEAERRKQEATAADEQRRREAEEAERRRALQEELASLRPDYLRARDEAVSELDYWERRRLRSRSRSLRSEISALLTHVETLLKECEDAWRREDLAALRLSVQSLRERLVELADRK